MSDYLPIVYVRGYAMTDAEVEKTFNMPYYGFNLGSTQYKLTSASTPQMYIFESPVVRLIKDEEYRDSFNAFVNPQNRPIPGEVPRRGADWRRTLWIFRFYDPEASLQQQERQKIEGYAADLAIFLNRVRRACGDPADFAVNLVAHSMGGLISRCYLQNATVLDDEVPKKLVGDPAERADTRAVPVHKFFTYGTPHRGISFRPGLGWAESVRDFFGFSGSDTFGPAEMRRYLGLDDGEDLHTYAPLAYAPPRKRIFCLVGTNYEDYVVRASQAAVGPGSDGLVAIENAYIKAAPRAYVHRAHSGPLGIVNSEAGYQNLSRFLFGDLRFKVFLRPGILSRNLPGLEPSDELEYLLVESNVTIRGLPGYIHTRTAEHLCAITVPMQQQDGGIFVPEGDDRIHLFTGHFRKSLRGVEGDEFARGAIDIRIEPHYRHRGWIRSSRYEGDWIMNDRLHFGVHMRRSGEMRLTYRWNSAVRPQFDDLGDGEAKADLPRTAQRFLDGGYAHILADAWA